MAYSDYGGYAYRNGERVIERSDACITPEGDTFGTPGMWPGWLSVVDKSILDYPKGHAILGDGPVFVALYKQSDLRIYRGFEKLDEIEYALDLPEDRITTWEYDGKTGRYIDHNKYIEDELPCVFEVDGHKIEVFWSEEDNFYMYAQLTQPDGTIWTGWSGYGVGAGFEDGDYGYSSSERDRCLKNFFPTSFVGK